MAGVLAALVAGVPLLPAPEGEPGRQLTSEGEPGRQLTSALELGVLLAAYSVTSPHTIHPEADLGTLVAFAAEVGLSFAPPLGDVI